MPGCGEVTQSGWGLWGRAGRGQVVRSGLAPWWSLCTLYLPHARWSCRRRLRSLVVVGLRSVFDVNCSSAISELLPIVCWYFRNCSSNAIKLAVVWRKSDERSIYNLFSAVRWNWPSFKVTIASQSWQICNLYYNCDISDNFLSYGHLNNWHDGKLRQVHFL